MTLRFQVDQAEAFRRGVDVPKSTVHLEVDPSTLPEAERLLIADTLEGIDVCLLQVTPEGDVRKATKPNGSVCRLQAKLPTYDSLMEAIRANQAMLEEQREKAQGRHRAEEALTRLADIAQGALLKE
jgi:hypothetical protein